jgi:hypothetical protein
VIALLLAGGLFSEIARGQVTTNIEDRADGVRYQVTRQVVQTQVPVTEYRDQPQTTYRYQVTTDNVPHQQVYNVPITQYQVVSELHGRWNPFVTPYWTQRYEPVTVWQQQVATVNIPVSRVAWVPETKTVQQPVTTWKVANKVSVVETPIGAIPSGAGSNTAIAAARPLPGATPSATLTPADQPAAMTASRPLGGEAISSDPPRSGWNTSPAATSGTRY